MQKIIEKLVDKFPKKLYDRVYGIERDCEGGTVLLEIKSNETDLAARIIVVGVGGAGNNAVNRMVDEQIKGVQVRSRRSVRKQLRRALRRSLPH